MSGLQANENYKIGNEHLINNYWRNKYANCKYGYIITVEYTTVGNKMNGNIRKWKGRNISILFDILDYRLFQRYFEFLPR
jgi:hypothetical protein